MTRLRRTLIASTAIVTVLVIAGHAQNPPRPLIANAKPVRSCESLANVALPDTTIESATVDAANPNLCRVIATTTHPPAGDKVRIWIAIPTANWNGRFLGTGGGGFSGGSATGVNQPASVGFAAGATDTGHEGGGASFALDPGGRLNWQAIRDFAHVGIHEMTVTGKALTQALYGVVPTRSYFNGCSTGGRQGLMEAQRYPQDYDGIVAAAPAINWTNLMMQSFWGSMLMNAASNPIPSCKLAAATAAAITACDAIDGVKDGVIEDPKRCTYDPGALVGTPAGDCGTFTQADADIIRKLWDGPRRENGGPLWYGPARRRSESARREPRHAARTSAVCVRARLAAVLPHAGSQVRLDDGHASGISAALGPIRRAVRHRHRHRQSRPGRIPRSRGQDDHLARLGRSTHHADGTIDYYTRVQQRMGGAQKTSEFARLFLAPGVGHCGGGAGPAPSGVLEALMAWVEDGKAPETLTAMRRDQAGLVTRSRPLCQYPLVAKYKGSGSTDDAANFACSSGF